MTIQPINKNKAISLLIELSKYKNIQSCVDILNEKKNYPERGVALLNRVIELTKDDPRARAIINTLNVEQISQKFKNTLQNPLKPQVIRPMEVPTMISIEGNAPEVPNESPDTEPFKQRTFSPPPTRSERLYPLKINPKKPGDLPFSEEFIRNLLEIEEKEKKIRRRPPAAKSTRRK